MNPPEKCHRLGIYRKSSDLPGLVGEVFPLPSCFGHCPGGHVHHPLAVAMFSDATGMRRSMLSMAARLFTMWLAAVLSTLYLTTHCMSGWAQLWNVSGWQSGQQIGCCNAKLLGMTKSVFLLPYFGVPYCWRNFGKREPKMVDKIVPQSYNAGLY